VKTSVIVAVSCLVAVLITAPLRAQQDETELAKKTQNPVADLISVPFQSNFNFGAGPNGATIYVLNVQPVIPLTLTEDWNLITRVITPVINQPLLFEGGESAFGLGDINPTFFLSPAKPGKLIWGVGPTFTLPTATDSLLGSSQWSIGPAAVALSMQGPWVFGALANQQWSFAGWGDRDVSQLLIQPFVNYNLPDAWYLVSAPIITADWEASSGNKWTVPLGGGGRETVQAGQAADQHPAAGLLQRGAAPVRGRLTAALPAAVPVPEVGRRAWSDQPADQHSRHDHARGHDAVDRAGQAIVSEPQCIANNAMAGAGNPDSESFQDANQAYSVFAQC
jgi:hypothetical protein